MQKKVTEKLSALSLLTFVFLTPFFPLSAEDATTNDFYLKDGDRVVFYGDSITNQRRYSLFVETYIVTRFPHLNITFFHSGWGGDSVRGGSSGGNIDQRLERDVFPYNPTVMTVMLGMNDGRYKPFDPIRQKAYKDGLTYIVEKTQTELPDLRLTLIQPSPYDDFTYAPKFEGGYNSTLLNFSKAVAEISEIHQTQLVDFNTPMVKLLNKAKEMDPSMAQKIIPDRIHPSRSGALVMTAELLKAWKAPATVTSVTIDMTTQSVNQSENTTISELQISPANNTIQWTQLDAALPMPINMKEMEAELVLKSSNIISMLNQQPLQITGLKTGQYELKIDGKHIEHFTAQELSKGVNLALLRTPMLKQAEQVHELSWDHSSLRQIRRSSYQTPFMKADESLTKLLPPILHHLAEAEVGAVNLQRALAQPLPHDYTIQPFESTKN
jgi:lysophospholipase L1-like esterase